MSKMFMLTMLRTKVKTVEVQKILENARLVCKGVIPEYLKSTDRFQLLVYASYWERMSVIYTFLVLASVNGEAY